jgi:hypothetical protein
MTYAASTTALLCCLGFIVGGLLSATAGDALAAIGAFSLAAVALTTAIVAVGAVTIDIVRDGD